MDLADGPQSEPSQGQEGIPLADSDNSIRKMSVAFNQKTTKIDELGGQNPQVTGDS